jgi:hypothetical protein
MVDKTNDERREGEMGVTTCQGRMTNPAGGPYSDTSCDCNCKGPGVEVERALRK